VYNAS
jgi:hypothetical protein